MLENNILQLFLFSVLEEIEARDIKYVVLRNIEEMYTLHSGDDVDIITTTNNLKKIESILDKCSAKYNGELILRDAEFWNRQSMYCFREQDSISIISFDLKNHAQHRGLVLIKSSEIIRDRISWRCSWRPCSSHEAAAQLYHAVLDKRQFKKGYMEKIESLYKSSPGQFSDILAEKMGNDHSAWVEECVNNNRQKELLDSKKWIANYLMINPTSIFSYIQYKLYSVYRLVKLMSKRRGALIVFLGPDGAGKSTIVDKIKEELESRQTFKVHEVYFGIGKPILPTKRLLQLIYRKRMKSHRKGQLPRESSEFDLKKKIIYTLGTMHTILDQVVRYMICVYIPLRRRRIILCDRYFYDAVTTPMPVGIEFAMTWFINHVVPKPDRIFILDSDANDIYERKPELSIYEIIRQQKAYKTLTEAPIKARIIEVNGPSDQLARRLIWDIMKGFGERNA